MSRFELYIHIVWGTQHRRPLLTPPVEEAVYACILAQAHAAGYEALAINGMPDHVHLLLRCGPRIDLSALMKKAKGVSSAQANGLLGASYAFRWGEGYYAATVTPAHLPGVRAYVQRQKDHHRANTLFLAWEEPATTGD